jgi:hypothetical protein
MSHSTIAKAPDTADWIYSYTFSFFELIWLCKASRFSVSKWMCGGVLWERSGLFLLDSLLWRKNFLH